MPVEGNSSVPPTSPFHLEIAVRIPSVWFRHQGIAWQTFHTVVTHLRVAGRSATGQSRSRELRPSLLAVLLGSPLLFNDAHART